MKEWSHLAKLWIEPYADPALGGSYGSYRPFAIFSFSLNFILFGDSPVSFHVVNIILNALAVFLLFLLVLKLFNHRKLAYFTALFYAFLPIHTEVVASIKSRDEILATIFVLLAWLLFIKSTEFKYINWRGVIGSSLLFLGAVLSKETFLLSPLIFIAVLWIRRYSRVKVLFGVAIAFGPVSMLYIWMRFKAIGLYALGNLENDPLTNPLLSGNAWQHIWTPFKIAFIYLEKIVFPFKLSATYFYNQVTLVSNPLNSIQVVLGIVFIGSLIFLIVKNKTRVTPLGIGALMFFVSYFMVSKFIFQAADIVAERWMYFPSAGLCLIMGYLILKVYDYKKGFGVAILSAVLIIYGLITINRNQVWLTGDSLFKSMIKDSPNSIQGYKLLYLLYLDHKPIEEVADLIETAHKIAPSDPAILDEMGVVESKKGNFESAERYFREAYSRDPKELYRNNLIGLYRISIMSDAEKGHYDEVLKQLKKLRILAPNDWETYFIFGQVYLLKKDYSKAIYYFKKALSYDPENTDIKSKLKLLGVSGIH